MAYARGGSWGFEPLAQHEWAVKPYISTHEFCVQWPAIMNLKCKLPLWKFSVYATAHQYLLQWGNRKISHFCTAMFIRLNWHLKLWGKMPSFPTSPIKLTDQRGIPVRIQLDTNRSSKCNFSVGKKYELVCEARQVLAPRRNHLLTKSSASKLPFSTSRKIGSRALDHTTRFYT